MRTIDTSKERQKTIAYGLIIAALPFLLALANPIWLNNTPGDWDVWIYYGYFNHLYQFSDHYIWPGNAYIGTRIPYILPGFLVHRLFGDDLYRYVLNIGIIYNAIVFSYYYVLRRFLSLDAAAAVTVLVATNFFLLRSIGWDYVDRAVTAYAALTFALLTLAGNTRRPWAALVGTGFTATSMIFVHVASVLLFPIFFLFSAFVIQRASTLEHWRQHFLRLLLFCGIGTVLAHFFFGLLTVLLHGGDFFFILKQIGVVKQNMGTWNYPLAVLEARGYWITCHLAVFLAATVVLLARGLGLLKATLTRFEAFWLWTLALGNGTLLFCEYKQYLWLLSRDGMHSTIFIPLSMIGYGVLLFRQKSPFTFGLAAITGLVSVLLLLGIQNGLGLSAFVSIPMPIIGAAEGAVLILSFIWQRRAVTAAALIALATLNSFNSWRFTDDRETRVAHARITRETSGRLPKIFYARNDPQLSPIWSILASFTDRALVPSGEKYPTLPNDLKQGDAVVILSSSESDADATRLNLLRFVRGAQPVDSFRAGDVWVHVFNVTTGP